MWFFQFSLSRCLLLLHMNILARFFSLFFVLLLSLFALWIFLMFIFFLSFLFFRCHLLTRMNIFMEDMFLVPSYNHCIKLILSVIKNTFSEELIGKYNTSLLFFIFFYLFLLFLFWSKFLLLELLSSAYILNSFYWFSTSYMF